MTFKETLSKIYYFLAKDNSIWSWIANIILAFLIVKFVFYPLLSLALGSSLPLVAVISGSMEHEGLKFDDWWEQNRGYYESQGITKEMFQEYPMKNGFNKGDVVILISARNLEPGQVAVYSTETHQYPIIHRVIYINEDENTLVFKGDNNDGPDPQPVSSDDLIGRAVAVIPWIGWVKIGFNTILGI